jgi:CBS domain-containing protein
MRVADVMSRRVHTLSPSQSLREAAQLLSKQDISGAPVIDDEGRILGYLSRTDLVDALAEHGDVASLRVEAAMSHEIISVPPGASVEEAAQTMIYEGVHRLVIRAEQGEPLGILSGLDALRALLPPR